MQAAPDRPPATVINLYPVAGVVCWLVFGIASSVAAFFWLVFGIPAIAMLVGAFFLPYVRLVVRPGRDVTVHQGPWCGLWPRMTVIPLDSIASVLFSRRVSFPKGGGMSQSHFLNVVMTDGSSRELIPSGFIPWNVDRFAKRVSDALGVPYAKQLDDPPVTGPAV